MSSGELPPRVLLDVNILMALFIDQHSHQEVAGAWYERAVAEDRELLVPEEVCASFIRLCRNESVFTKLLPGQDLEFLGEFLGRPKVRVVLPSAARLRPALAFIERLRLGPKGIPDAFLAALAIELDVPLATFDKGFAKYEGLTLEPMLAEAIG